MKLRLTPTEHERLARQYAERVYNTIVALEPLYEAPGAIEWLNSHQAALSGDRPANLLAFHSGTERVAQAIAIILDGAHS
jgi:uncharacterized protein (DUF2384 family)